MRFLLKLKHKAWEAAEPANSKDGRPTSKPRETIAWVFGARVLYCGTVSVLFVSTIEGLHDEVRTHRRTILPRSLVSFLYGEVWRTCDLLST